MRRWIFSVLLVLCISGVAQAQDLGVDEVLTIDDTAGGVFIATATHAPTGLPQNVYCTGQLENAAIRRLDNRGIPTSSNGMPVAIGETVEIFGHAYIQAARFIRTGVTSGEIHFTCYPRYPAWAQ